MLIVLWPLIFSDRDMLDHARVVDVRPSPDGKRAAVLYYYSHANTSNWTVRLAIAEQPFPLIGQDYYSRADVAAVSAGPSLSDGQIRSALPSRWRTSREIDVCMSAKELLVVSIDGSSTGKAVTGPVKATLSCDGM